MFIVIEGLDGAGKSTQIKLLQDYLLSNGIDNQFLHFPRFNSPIYGDLIARFLRGEFGEVQNVHPLLVALLYAGDRGEAKTLIETWLSEQKTVLLDRYVYSNIAYQCAKATDSKQQQEIRQWILDTEYDHFKIPKPDINIFLDVPFSFTQKKLSEIRTGNDRDYLNGKQDIHEASFELQRKVREIYLAQQAQDSTFKVLNCVGENGLMLSPNEIFNQINQIILSL